MSNPKTPASLIADAIIEGYEIESLHRSKIRQKMSIVREAAQYVIDQKLLLYSEYTPINAADHALFAIIGLDDYAKMDIKEADELMDEVAELSWKMFVGPALRQALNFTA